jgi:hypothetical protein
VTERTSGKPDMHETAPRFAQFAAADGAFGEMMQVSKFMFRDRLRALTSENRQFVARRLQHTREAMERYVKCTDTAGLAAVQQKWFADLARDYYEEAARMGEASRKIIARGGG